MNMSVTLTTPRVTKLRDGTSVMVPAVARFTPEEPSADFPIVEIEVDVHAGRPVVTRASLVASAETPLNSDAVRSYSLHVLAAHALHDLTLRVLPDGEISTMRVDIGDGKTYAYDNSAAAWERIVTAVRQRTSVGRDRLEDVARFYRAGGVAAVSENLVISRSQAYRLVAQARKTGLIEERQ
jgi:hypothetical protein